MTKSAGLTASTSIAHHATAIPSAWVKRFAPLIPPGGRILDLASGSGRHSIFLAQQGHAVLAVDRDGSALTLLELAKGELPITIQQCDLEGDQWPLDSSKTDLFDAIVVTNYLYRPFLDSLPLLLAEGGILLYETFANGNANFGKPSNPDFLLHKGELLDFALRHHLAILAYEDLYQPQPKPAMIQRICAVKGELKDRHPLQFQG